MAGVEEVVEEVVVVEEEEQVSQAHARERVGGG
jgi:hypothetical protein